METTKEAGGRARGAFRGVQGVGAPGKTRGKTDHRASPELTLTVSLFRPMPCGGGVAGHVLLKVPRKRL
eukprot:945376-Alexandrium_andersonii.AAC.1